MANPLPLPAAPTPAPLPPIPVFAAGTRVGRIVDSKAFDIANDVQMYLTVGDRAYRCWLTHGPDNAPALAFEAFSDVMDLAAQLCQQGQGVVLVFDPVEEHS